MECGFPLHPEKYLFQYQQKRGRLSVLIFTTCLNSISYFLLFSLIFFLCLRLSGVFKHFLLSMVHHIFPRRCALLFPHGTFFGSDGGLLRCVFSYSWGSTEKLRLKNESKVLRITKSLWFCVLKVCVHLGFCDRGYWVWVRPAGVQRGRSELFSTFTLVSWFSFLARFVNGVYESVYVGVLSCLCGLLTHK